MEATNLICIYKYGFSPNNAVHNLGYLVDPTHQPNFIVVLSYSAMKMCKTTTGITADYTS
jgi:hypothetical protein